MLTNVGTLILNKSLPEDLRQPGFTLDKKGVHKLLQQVAEKHPEKYQDILHSLNELGRNAGWTEGVSVSLSGLRTSKAKAALMAEIQPKLDAIRDDDSIDDKQRADAIRGLLIPYVSKMQDSLMAEGKAENNPFHMQISTGARGKKADLSSLRGADLLVEDQTGNMLPIPVLKSYAEGMTPADYFAASYGQRKGALSVKMGVADAGYISKTLSGATHRITVTKEKPDTTRLPTGLPTGVGDPELVGQVLNHPAGKYPAGTLITPQIRDDLADEGIDEVLVSSPMAETSEDGGISRWAAGRRDKVHMNNIGDNVGLTSAQAVGEKLSQGLLSAKHSAGISDRVNKSGIEYLYKLLGAPEHFAEAGALAHEDGAIEDVRKAEQGGHYVKLNGKDIYLNPGLNPLVKAGDKVEAGDDLSDGVPHPQQLVKYRGIGEARRVYADALHQALNDSGVEVNKRNVQTVVAGLLNWAKVTNPDGIGDNVVDDIAPINRLLHNYQPRKAATLVAPRQAMGKYLEEPVLHYTPGTRVTSKVQARLDKFGIKDVTVHDDPPDFEPEFVRNVLSTYHDPDWQTRLGGFYTAKSFQNAVHRGATSDRNSTSYIPALAAGDKFGKNLSTTGHYNG